MRIGVDVGGTKIEVVGLSSAGKELRRMRVPTPKGDYDGTVQAVKNWCARWKRRRTGWGASAWGFRGR